MGTSVAAALRQLLFEEVRGRPTSRVVAVRETTSRFT